VKRLIKDYSIDEELFDLSDNTFSSELLKTLLEMESAFSNHPEIRRHKDPRNLFQNALSAYLKQLTNLFTDKNQNEKQQAMLTILKKLALANGELNRRLVIDYRETDAVRDIRKKSLQINKKVKSFNKYYLSVLSKLDEIAPDNKSVDIRSSISSLIKSLDQTARDLYDLNSKAKKNLNRVRTGPTTLFFLKGHLSEINRHFKKLLVGKRFYITSIKRLGGGQIDDTIFEKQNLRHQYRASPLRLLANGLYLAGLPAPHYNEAHLRQYISTWVNTLRQEASRLYPE